MAGPMSDYRYVSDAGVNYRARLDDSNAALTGCAAADGTELEPPKGLRRRYVLAQLPGGNERRLTVCSTAHATWTGATTTVSLPDFGNNMAAVTATLRGRVGEKRYTR